MQGVHFENTSYLQISLPLEHAAPLFLLPPSWFLSGGWPADSLRFLRTILHFSIFIPSSCCLAPLILFGFALCLEGALGCQHPILPNVCQHPTLQNVCTYGSLTAIALASPHPCRGRKELGHRSQLSLPREGFNNPLRKWQYAAGEGGVASLNQSQPSVSAGMGSQDDILAIQPGRGLRRSLVQPPAQSRFSSEITPGSLRRFPQKLRLNGLFIWENHLESSL